MARLRGDRAGVEGALGALWAKLDEAVEELYGLSREERAVIARYPRKVDRVKLVLRQARGATRSTGVRKRHRGARIATPDRIERPV